MIVVADASPINYLVLIDAVYVLPTLFTQIVIPQAVYLELHHPSAPVSVRRWIAHKPDWLLVQQAVLSADQDLQLLDEGEREAILVAERVCAKLIILDERAARQIATQRGLRITGTLGVLNVAGQHKLIDIPQAVARLRSTSFRAAPKLYQWLLEQSDGLTH